MGFLNKKFLIALLALILAGGLSGCDLLSTAATTQPVTTVSTASTTTEPTTTLPTTTTTLSTAVQNVAILLSGTWKTVYDFGTPFDPTGLVVTLLKTDASETVVGEYFVLGFNPSVSGLQTVRIRYSGLEASFVVYVKEAAILEDVALVLDLPDKLVYQPGQAADWTGLSVHVVQSDGDRIELTDDVYALSGFDSSTPGLVTIIVTYGDLTATFPIYVAETSAGGISLSVTPPTKTVYDEGEAFSAAGMVVTLNAAGESPIVLATGEYVVDVPDTSVVGVHDVAVTALGLTAWFSITVTSPALDLIPYFDAAEGLEGEALVLALRDIITDYIGISYGDVRYLLDETDADPAHAGYLIEWYTGQSRNAAWDGGITYNREHVWPQSLLGVSVDNSYIGVGSDIFNLTPADPGINSSRGNKWFSTVTNTYSYLPTRTAIHGDIARILFYMTIMYDYLELVELGSSQDPLVHQMGDLSTLLAWHLADPVDDFERNRNAVIFSYQHNRNPFVDHPELVELIWG